MLKEILENKEVNEASGKWTFTPKNNGLSYAPTIDTTAKLKYGPHGSPTADIDISIGYNISDNDWFASVWSDAYYEEEVSLEDYMKNGFDELAEPGTLDMYGKNLKEVMDAVKKTFGVTPDSKSIDSLVLLVGKKIAGLA